MATIWLWAAAAVATVSRARGSRSTAYTLPSWPTTSARATLTSPPPAPTSTQRQPSRSPSRSRAVASGRRYTSLRSPSSITKQWDPSEEPVVVEQRGRGLAHGADAANVLDEVLPTRHQQEVGGGRALDRVVDVALGRSERSASAGDDDVGCRRRGSIEVQPDARAVAEVRLLGRAPGGEVDGALHAAF